MSNSKRRRWVMPLRRMITAVFAVGFCLSLISTFNASAAANRFKIQSVKLDKLSETVEGEIAEFNEQNIKTNVVFHNVGDAVKYTITLKNTDSKESRNLKFYYIIIFFVDDEANAVESINHEELRKK